MKILKVLDTVLFEGSVREILYYFFCRSWASSKVIRNWTIRLYCREMLLGK